MVFAHISHIALIFALLILLDFSPYRPTCCYPALGGWWYRRIIILRKYYKQGDCI